MKQKINPAKITPLKISAAEKMEPIIKRTIAGRGKRFAGEFYRRNILARFTDIVGEAVARRVNPVAINNSVLYLYVPDAVWKNEIKFSEQKIIDKLNDYAGINIAKKIEFIKSYQIPKLTPQINSYINLELQNNIKINKIKKEIIAENITNEEINNAKKLTQNIGDDALARLIGDTYLKNIKLKKWQQKNYIKCEICHNLIDGENKKICFFCREKKINKIKIKIKKYLNDIPWAKITELKNNIPDADNYLVNNVRMELVKSQLEKIKALNITDKEHIEIKTLIMIYKSVSPEALTPTLVDKSLYELKNDLGWKNNI